MVDYIGACPICHGNRAAYPQAPSGQQAEPTDEQLIALNAGERFFSESPTKYPEAGHGTQYHAGAPGVVGFARAAIALAGQQSERPAPAGQAVGEPGDMRQALSDLRYAVNARPSCQENLIARCRCLKCAMLRSYDLLASSQAEPAVKEGDKP
jgi:hypothetical protein